MSADERRHERMNHPAWGLCTCSLAKAIRADAIAQHYRALAKPTRKRPARGGAK